MIITDWKECEKYVGTLWWHTRKALKHESCVSVIPSDRIFAVTRVEQQTFDPREKGITKRDRAPYLVAWKCVLLPNGLLDHPAYKRPLKADDPRLFVKKGRNGSEPSADFNPGDSFYELWDGRIRKEAAVKVRR
jgi:hypothetical protein